MPHVHRLVHADTFTLLQPRTACRDRTSVINLPHSSYIYGAQVCRSRKVVRVTIIHDGTSIPDADTRAPSLALLFLAPLRSILSVLFVEESESVTEFVDCRAANLVV